MYKILNSLPPEMMNNIFKSRTNYYNTLNGLTFCKRNVKTVRYGLQTSLTWVLRFGNLHPNR